MNDVVRCSLPNKNTCFTMCAGSFPDLSHDLKTDYACNGSPVPSPVPFPACNRFPVCNRFPAFDCFPRMQSNASSRYEGEGLGDLVTCPKQMVVPLQYHSYSKDLCLSVPNVPKIVPWSPVFGQNMTRNRWTLPHVCLSGITPSRDHLPGLPLSLHACTLEAIRYLGRGTHTHRGLCT